MLILWYNKRCWCSARLVVRAEEFFILIFISYEWARQQNMLEKRIFAQATLNTLVVLTW